VFQIQTYQQDVYRGDALAKLLLMIMIYKAVIFIVRGCDMWFVALSNEVCVCVIDNPAAYVNPRLGNNWGLEKIPYFFN
jgi:hypothetical protein